MGLGTKTYKCEFIGPPFAYLIRNADGETIGRWTTVSAAANHHTIALEQLDALRDEVARLKEENFALQKQLCNYQLAEIGSKLVEEMEDDEDAATR